VDDEFAAMYVPPLIPICPYTCVPIQIFDGENALHAIDKFEDALETNCKLAGMKLPYALFDDQPVEFVMFHDSTLVAFELVVSVYTPGAVKFPNMLLEIHCVPGS
jgi:hypothetical protein